jgi:hypothetical protein
VQWWTISDQLRADADRVPSWASVTLRVTEQVPAVV